jgi:hypothetical protein
MIVNLVDDAQYQSTNSKITEDISILYLIHTKKEIIFYIFTCLFDDRSGSKSIFSF